MDPGDTIFVGDGDYLGFDVEIDGAPGMPITIRAQGSGANVLPTSDRADNRDTIHLDQCSYIVLDGLRSFNANRAAVWVNSATQCVVRNGVFGNNARWGIFTDHADDLLLENNEVYGSRAEHGIYVADCGDRPVVRGNRVHTNFAAGIQMNSDLDGHDALITGAVIENNLLYGNGTSGGGAALALLAVQDSVVRNNLLVNNRGAGIVCWQGDGAAGPSGMKIVNNTVDMAADGKWALHMSTSVGPNLACNNILLNRHAWRGGLRLTEQADLDHLRSDHNVLSWISLDDGASRVSLKEWQGMGQDLHSLSAAPDSLFVNAAAGDYRLRAGSPAVDAGETVAEVLVDRDGHIRPAGAAYDIGCCESAGVQAPVTATVSLATGRTMGGTSVAGTITLSAAAPSSGLTVALASSSSSAAVPASVTVPAGATSRTFTVTTAPVREDTAVAISATANGISRSAALTLTRAGLTSLSINPGSVPAGTSASGTVALDGPAPAGGADVALSSSSAALTVSGSVRVPEGANTATFSIATAAVTADVTAELSASYGGVTRSASLTIQAAPAKPPVLTALSLSAARVVRGTTATGTVTLSAPAPAGGVAVDVRSSKTTAAAVEARVTVPEGATTATFNVTTKQVRRNAAVTITATYAGVRKTARLTVSVR